MDKIDPSLKKLSINIADITPDPANVRFHDKRNLESIKNSLKLFGQRTPIVIQKKGMVVRAGNARLQVAKELGWDKIAGIIVDEDDVQATAYALADNRTSDLSVFDDDARARPL